MLTKLLEFLTEISDTSFNECGDNALRMLIV